jgi:hypothetical protein
VATLQTEVVKVTIDRPFDEVARYVGDPSSAHEWATEFFAGPLKATKGDEFVATVPMMGGEVRYRQDADLDKGVIDIYLAPRGGNFGPPLPVRVLPNGGGADVLYTLAQFPGTSDQAWQAGLQSMARELENLKQLLESR